MFDNWIWLIILIALLSFVGTVIWWAFVMFVVYKAAKHAPAHFAQQLQQALQAGRRLQSLPPPLRTVPAAQMSAMLTKLDTQISQLDQLSHLRYECRMDDLSRIAASVGIDWAPPDGMKGAEAPLSPNDGPARTPKMSPAPTDLSEPVLLGVTAPRSSLCGAKFNAVLAVYVESARASAQAKLERLGGSVAVPLLDIPPDRQSGWIVGAPVTVRVTALHADVDPAERSFEWNGRENLAAFTVHVHDDAPGAELDLCFHVALANIPIASIPLPVALLAPAASEAPRVECILAAHSAFASYSSKDAQTVGYCLSTLARWSPGLDIFQDCLDLNPSELFKPQLAKRIGSSDVFMLFWSRNASASPWVHWEYDTARQTKGLAAVIPMPLEDPKIAPPPPEFESSHMRDRFMVARYGLARINEIAEDGRSR